MSIAFVALLVSAGCDKDETPTAPTPTLAITLTGNVAFGDVTVGTTMTSTLTIGNTGTADLTVTFAPTAAQQYSGSITVTGNQASGTNTIAASGIGVSLPTFTLSGIVTETPPTTSTVIAGVRVAFVDGANQGKSATTGADGRYQIAGVVNGGYAVSATVAGYTAMALPVGINGNTTLDFRLDPLTLRTQFGPGQYRVPADMPVGRYYSDPVNGCHFQRVSGFGGAPSDTIVDAIVDFDAGQWIVDLLATDAGFTTDINCGTWFMTPRQAVTGSGCAASRAPLMRSSPARSRAVPASSWSPSPIPMLVSALPPSAAPGCARRNCRLRLRLRRGGLA